MKVISLIVIIAFVGLNAVLFHMAYSHGGSFCVAALANGKEAPCPEGNVFGFLAYHLSAFNNLNLAVIISLIIGLFVGFYLLLQNLQLFFDPVQFPPVLKTVSVPPHFVKKRLFWLSLLEKRDPVRLI